METNHRNITVALKPIKGFSRYVADENGNVYSTNYKNSGRTVMIKPSDRDGYYQSMFQHDSGKYMTKKIHFMVALAYFGERKEGEEVNHIDGNKLNNAVSNLEYCTRSQNIQHAFDNGLAKGMRGEDNVTAKLTANDVREIRSHVENFKGRFYGRKMLAEKYNVSECCIKEIVNRRRNGWASV